MSAVLSPSDPESPFHPGEQAVQTRVGVRKIAEDLGSRVIRDYMPDQHRAFYQQLPYLFLGHKDQNGRPWASIVHGGGSSFLTSPDARQLQLPRTALVPHDPLHTSLQHGTPLGVLGIESTTRRRNRLTGTADQLDNDTLAITVRQAFGNCPQYIQSRELTLKDQWSAADVTAQDILALSTADQDLVATSSTFYVASYYEAQGSSASHGADVSHRGGRPGFVQVVDERTLLIPDFAGNNHFNTLGNIEATGKAGLLFIDFASGDLLSLTGDAEILWDSPEAKAFEGAQRVWRFRLVSGVRITNALPFTWSFEDFSPNSLLTGTWQEAQQHLHLKQVGEQWQPYRVGRIVAESDGIRSIYLQAPGGTRMPYEAGQFLTIKRSINDVEQIRTYTLSSAPDDSYYRISVKREASGTVSSNLHDTLEEGETVWVRPPGGAFTLADERPAVLLGAGIGITPFIAMAKQALHDSINGRGQRQLTLIHQTRDNQDSVFREELDEIEQLSGGRVRVIRSMSRPQDTLVHGADFNNRGRIDRQLLQSVLPVDDYQYYLCGPGGFMQSSYDLLQELGVEDRRIHAEAFGPSALKRNMQPSEAVVQQPPVAESATVTFSGAGVERSWSAADGSLLDFAESQGLSPDYGCRSGQCGSCKTRVLKGRVSHSPQVSVPLADDEALLCCAMPAATGGNDAELVLML